MSDPSRVPSLVVPFALVGGAAGWLSADFLRNPLVAVSDGGEAGPAAVIGAFVAGGIGAALTRWCAVRMDWAFAEAVAFGMPHPAWGEEVAVAVVLREPQDEAALLAFCREHLADFKCPKKIHIVETIPRTATGKIQRRAVAAAFSGGEKA